MLINIMGAKTAAILQTVLTCIIGGAGILLIVASVINGTVDNLDGQMFVGNTAGLNIKAILGVAAMSPFYFIISLMLFHRQQKKLMFLQRKSVKCLFYL